MNKILIGILALLLNACSAVQIDEISKGEDAVRLYTTYASIENCQFVDEIVGSQGTWYDYWFTSNKNLTQGAVNDLKIEAKKINANSVHLHSNMGFNTSVTILAQAYHCSKNEK